MKSFFKRIITRGLWAQVKYLRSKHKILVIGVAGSIGKTSTKYTVAQLLEQKFKVRWQKGNYNDIVSAPLVFFDRQLPSLYNPIAWIRIMLNNHKQVKHYQSEVVILELGTDGPHQIAEFGKYLKLDIAIVTAVAPEHMEFFDSIDDVAKEELSIVDFSEQLIVNTDLVDEKYLEGLAFLGYGKHGNDFMMSVNADKLAIKKNSKQWLSSISISSLAEAYSKTCASIVAHKLDMADKLIHEGLQNVDGAPGRLQILKGINGSIIIDDTYNSSPEAVMSALDLLYGRSEAHKIAILGNMNELGNFSKAEHQRIGNYCSSDKLDLVITIGQDANKYLAKTAKTNGCNVKTFDNPYEIGEFLKNELSSDTAVLLKGSQNGVYLEEAIKPILASKKDIKKLVRQSNHWLKKKQESFQKLI